MCSGTAEDFFFEDVLTLARLFVAGVPLAAAGGAAGVSTECEGSSAPFLSVSSVSCLRSEGAVGELAPEFSADPFASAGGKFRVSAPSW